MFKIFIGNVNFKTTEDNLRDIFSPHITIEDLVIARDPKTGRSMGYGFVMTRDKDKGRDAMRRIGKVLIDGRRIYLKESRDKKAKGSAPEMGGRPPFRPRRPRPPGAPFTPRPAFPQRRPMGSNGPIGPLGPNSRPMPPRTNPPLDRFSNRTAPPPFPQTGGGYVGLNQDKPTPPPSSGGDQAPPQ